MNQQRVLADGWGDQATGSVFCADSSLRYIYERHPQTQLPSNAAALTSLASPYDHKMPHYDGKSTQSNGRNSDGVDLFEAEIAKACTAINKQVPKLPPSCRECSVCLTPNAYAQIASCGHTFHSPCFLRWFRSNRSCPLCRGTVDRIQLAPVPSLNELQTEQDELEAMMAEIIDQDASASAAVSMEKTGNDDVEMMIGEPDLISFLDVPAFEDSDVDMVPLEDVEMPEDIVQEPVKQEQVAAKPPAPTPVAPPTPVVPPPPMPAFAPSSTMPNYWNVLNQGLAHIAPPPVIHNAPAPTPHRMVHIAPKPVAGMPQHPHLIEKRIRVPISHSPLTSSPSRTSAVVSCRCTGGCRNGRCACVKDGAMCGVSCRCTSCKNPFLMVQATASHVKMEILLQDPCFMHSVPKTRDMVQRLHEQVQVPCCEHKFVHVKDCVHGFTCQQHQTVFDFSWCTGKLLDQKRTPRNHCAICKRCCDHRDVHCHDCNRCYFAGVTASLPCPCKERNHHHHHHSSTTTQEQPTTKDDNETPEECVIM